MNEAVFQSLPVLIANARAYQAQALGDIPGSVKYAQQALDLLPEDDYFERGVAAALLGLAYWASGDLEAADQTFTGGLANMRKAGNILAAISGTFALASIKMARGRLREAITLYEQSLRLATEQNKPVLRGTAGLYVGLSELHHAQGDLDTATQELLKSEELGEAASLPKMQYRSRAVIEARMKQSQGDLDSALNLLNEAERLYIRGPVPDVRPIAALKTRVWIAQGRLTEALDWAREQGLSTNDDLNYLREFDHITLARIRMAQFERDRKDHFILDALELLERLLKAAEAGGRMGSAIEILVLQALARQAQGDVSAALVSLEQALTLAEPEGYVQIFVDEGQPMAHLLYEALSRGISPNYVQQLLAAFPLDEQTQEVPSKQQTQTPKLIEPLSKREIEVLHLIAEGLTNQEIANKLFLSLNTVKVHTRNIYGKLGAHHRADAVAKAKTFGILSTT